MNLRIRFKWQELYFKIMWICTIFLYVLMPSDSGLLSIVYYGIHLVSILTFIAVVCQAKVLNGFNAKRLAAIGIILMTTVLSAVASESNISFSVHIMGALGFLEMLFAIYIMDMLEYKKELTRFVYRANIVVALVLTALYFTPYAYSSDVIGSLNLGYANPNAAAIYLLMCVAIITIFFTKEQKFWQKVLVFALGAFLIYMLWLTQSRTCLFAAILIVVYRFFIPKWRLPKWTIWLFMLIPLLFLFLYAYLYEQGQYMNQQLWGKDFFSGREGYYVEKLQELKGTWMVGDFGMHYFTNSHNGPLALLLNIGVIGYGAYLWFIGKTLGAYYKRIRSYSQAIALVVIFAIFVHSCSEAAMTVGGGNYAILVATIYWILKGANEQNEHSKENQ